VLIAAAVKLSSGVFKAGRKGLGVKIATKFFTGQTSVLAKIKN